MLKNHNFSLQVCFSSSSFCLKIKVTSSSVQLFFCGNWSSNRHDVILRAVQFENWGCGLLWEAFRVKREWAVGCWPTFQTACKMMSPFPSRSKIGSSKARKTKKREEVDIKKLK